MISSFPLEDLEKIVEPDTVQDVLDSLKANGLVHSYDIDYRNGVVTVAIPKGVEVREMLDTLQIPMRGKVKGSSNARED